MLDYFLQVALLAGYSSSSGRRAANATMRCRLLVLVALAQARPQQYDPEGGRGPSRPAVAGVPGAAPRATGPPLSRQPGQPGQIGRAVQRYQSFVNGAAKVSRWIHVGCGFWVIVSTPVSLISSGARSSAQDAKATRLASRGDRGAPRRLPSAGRDDAVRLPRLVWIRERRTLHHAPTPAPLASPTLPACPPAPPAPRPARLARTTGH